MQYNNIHLLNKDNNKDNKDNNKKNKDKKNK